MVLDLGVDWEGVGPIWMILLGYQLTEMQIHLLIIDFIDFYNWICCWSIQLMGSLLIWFWSKTFQFAYYYVMYDVNCNDGQLQIVKFTLYTGMYYLLGWSS